MLCALHTNVAKTSLIDKLCTITEITYTYAIQHYNSVLLTVCDLHKLMLMFDWADHVKYATMETNSVGLYF